MAALMVFKYREIPFKLLFTNFVNCRDSIKRWLSTLFKNPAAAYIVYKEAKQMYFQK